MPNTLPPTAIDATAAYPVHPMGHGKAGYSTGDDLPAVVADSAPGSPLEGPASRTSHSPSDSRARSPFRKDPFFQPESRSASREPGRAELLQKEAALRQVRAAQDASYEADLERAIRRSKRDAAQGANGERSDSHARGLSRIRSAIKDIVSDPFWHRVTKEESEHQDEAMRRIILEEVAAARASTDAGSRDRAARSKSRARSPLSSQPGSRSQSRVRSVMNALSGVGEGNDRAAGGAKEDKATGTGATEERGRR